MDRAEHESRDQHAKAMARYDKADQRMDRLEKKLNVTADLVRGGIKMVREMRLEDRKSQAEARCERRTISSIAFSNYCTAKTSTDTTAPTKTTLARVSREKRESLPQNPPFGTA